MQTKKNTLVVALGGLILLGYQNCAPANFTGATANSAKAASAGPELPDSNQPPKNPTTQAGPDGDHDADCEKALRGTSASVVYDAIPAANSPAKDFKIGLSSINYETIGTVGNGFTLNARITARTIDDISSFGALTLEVNSHRLTKLHDFGALISSVIADDVGTISNMAGLVCISAHSIDSLQELWAGISIYGQPQNGARATLRTIDKMAGVISLHDLDMDSIEHDGLFAKFTNVHLKTLKGVGGRFILINSQIDDISEFGGEIVLRDSSSSVGQVSHSSAVVLRK